MDGNDDVGESVSASSSVFGRARDLYASCMDTERLEEVGLAPLTDKLSEMGGWPAVEGDSWDETAFSWEDTMHAFRRNGYSTDLLFDFSVATDIRNSSFRTIYLDQALLGMSREYIVKGFDDDDVQHYYKFMQQVNLKRKRRTLEKIYIANV